MDPRPGRRRFDRCDRLSAVRETTEEVRGGGGVGTAPSAQRETRSGFDEDADRVGHHGKSARALGAAVRDGARPDTTGAAEEALRTAFSELRAAKVSIARACALTGRSRATHYRRADPAGVTLGPLHGPHRPRRLPNGLALS